jgi:uncharacterized protein
MAILQDVIDHLPEGAIKDIHLGEHWNAVVAQVNGCVNCGMASNPGYPGVISCEATAELANSLKDRPALETCKLALEKDLRLASIGVATMNALLPRMPESYVSCNAESVIARKGAGKRVAMVGRFPCVTTLREQVGRLDVLELNPQPGDYPAEAAPEIIPQADILAITGMTLINGTLEGLLKLCSSKTYVVMLGPSVLLSPVLFDYGVDLLGGSIVENIEPVLKGIDDGYSDTIFPLGVRMVIMSREKIQ